MDQSFGRKIIKLILSITCCGLIILLTRINSYADDATIVGSQITGNTGTLAKVVDELGNASGNTGSGTAVPDLFTGTFSYVYPIEVPSGRNGIQPNIALTYRSSNGNGLIGLGWELEVGAIERSTRGGLDYGGSSFVYRNSGASLDMVLDGTQYRAKIEGEFIRISEITGTERYWVATNKSGVKFYFGQVAATRQHDPADPTKVFKWCLDRIEDPNGNYMTFSYLPNDQSQGQMYLDRIDYTGNVNGSVNGPLPTTNFVKFYWEPRSDVTEMYTTNFQVKTAYRLKTIDVIGGRNPENRVRIYSLSYADNSTVSVLSSIQQFGSDATVSPDGLTVSGPSVLPATSFGYSGGSSNFTGYLNGPPLSDANGWDKVERYATIRSVDINGDGKADICGNDSDGIKCWLSDGSGFPTRKTGPALADSDGWNDPKYFATIQFADINGDGTADLCARDSSGIKCWLFADGGFSYDPIIGPALSDAAGWGDPSRYYTIQLGDVNGDGKADICGRDSSGMKCWLSDGVGFPTEITGPALSDDRYWNYWTSAYSTIRLVDINGDGKADICARNTINGVYCWLSDGAGFPKEITGPPWSNIDGWDDPKYYSTIQYPDINGDGKADICTRAFNGISCWLSNGAGFQYVDIAFPYMSDSNGWSDPQYYQTIRFADLNGDRMADICGRASDGIHCWQSKNTGFNNAITGPVLSDAQHWDNIVNYSTIRFMDINGDGKPDLCARGRYGIFCWKIVDDGPKLLTSIVNGLGQTTSISYAPSTQYTNTQLPFPIQTVSAITRCDGNNLCGTTSYNYSGGFYHIGERDFRGFNYVTVTGVKGLNGEQRITETWFHQGNDTAADFNDPNVAVGYMKGKPYRIQVTDGDGRLFSETTINYAANTAISYYFTPPSQVDTIVYDGDSTMRHTRTAYTYDTFGNVIREDQYGDINTPLDDRTVTRDFLPNESAWIVGLPSNETVYQGIDSLKKMASTDYFYDSGTDCTTFRAYTPQASLKGNLTSIRRWFDRGPGYLDTWAAYDPYGNVACQRDANTNVTTFGYDASFIFPTTVINPLGHQTVTRYYGVDAVPADTGLYGEVKSITFPKNVYDPNSVLSYEYDKLGRKKVETKPDGFWTKWNYNNFGSFGSQHVKIFNSEGLWSERYFDGYGRTIRERSSGPDGNTIITETQYDSRGVVLQSTYPYFEYSETDSPRWVTYKYEPMGRVKQITNPDSSRTLACYSPGVRVQIDENNHRKRETYDAYGLLAKVEEYNGVYGTCTTDAGTPYATTIYQYDVLGNLRFVTDANQNQTEMRYDSLGRKYWMKDPDMGIWQYEYDGNGNLLYQTDARNKVSHFTYDALDRLKNKEAPVGTTIASYVYDEEFSTNAVGRLTTMHDGSGTEQFYYDTRGRNTRSVRTVSGPIVYTTRANYDGLDRIRTLTYPDPGNETVIYDYDTGGNLYKAGSYATLTGYNTLGQPGTVTFGNGVRTVYSYFQENNRLSGILTTGAEQAQFVNLAYAYDNKGNVTELRDHVNNAIPHNHVNQTFTLSPGKAHAIGSSSTGQSFDYDPNGNMISDGVRSILYSDDNLPETISSGVQTTRFTYDGFGSRLQKTGSITYIGKTYECFFDSGANICSKFIFAGDARIAVKTDTETLYYHTDHLGSTIALTNAGGSKVENIVYYPFGESRSDTGTAGVDHKFTGQELDGETGLYNYNARLYSSDIGRFVSPDPIISDPSDPQNLNRYSYVLNNPLNLIDPSGNTATITVTNTATNGGGGGYGGGGEGTGDPEQDVKPWIERFERIGRGFADFGRGVGDFFSSVGDTFSCMFGCNDTPPAPSPPHPSFSFDHGVGQSSYSNLNSSSIKLPLINNFIDAPQQYDDASFALGFTPIGAAGTVGKAATNIMSNSLRPIVIGENMVDRVIPYAKKVGAEWYKPYSKNPGNWMKNNERWLNKMVKQGREIIDIGIDPVRSMRSSYYEMELGLLNKLNYPVKRLK